MVVDLFVTDAPGPADYVLGRHQGSERVTIAASATSATLTVPTHNDTYDEPDAQITARMWGYNWQHNPHRFHSERSASVLVGDNDNLIPSYTVPGLSLTAAESEVFPGELARFDFRFEDYIWPEQHMPRIYVTYVITSDISGELERVALSDSTEPKTESLYNDDGQYVGETPTGNMISDDFAVVIRGEAGETLTATLLPGREVYYQGRNNVPSYRIVGPDTATVTVSSTPRPNDEVGLGAPGSGLQVPETKAKKRGQKKRGQVQLSPFFPFFRKNGPEPFFSSGKMDLTFFCKRSTIQHDLSPV